MEPHDKRLIAFTSILALVGLGCALIAFGAKVGRPVILGLALAAVIISIFSAWRFR